MFADLAGSSINSTDLVRLEHKERTSPYLFRYNSHKFGVHRTEILFVGILRDGNTVVRLHISVAEYMPELGGTDGLHI